MIHQLTFAVAFGIAIAGSALAQDLAPTLGKPGKQLLKESFDGPETPKGWTTNTGAMKIHDGTLRLSELAADKHIGAFRKALPIQNMAIQFDFMFDGAKAFNIGFDPAAGELKKKGHLYAITVTPNGWSIVENNDKANPESKPVTHAGEKTKFESGKWYTLLLENKGEEVVATIQGMKPLKAKAADFKVKKPALVFRAGGPDAAGVCIDNLSVWELE